MAKDFYFFAKVAKFLQIWSHWRLPTYLGDLKLSIDDGRYKTSSAKLVNTVEFAAKISNHFECCKHLKWYYVAFTLGRYGILRSVKN